jgi:hypothetical protein
MRAVQSNNKGVAQGATGLWITAVTAMVEKATQHNRKEM